MFLPDPQNKPLVRPPLDEPSRRTVKRVQQEDSLQKQLDSRKKVALSNPSSITITNRSFWAANDRDAYSSRNFLPRFMGRVGAKDQEMNKFNEVSQVSNQKAHLPKSQKPKKTVVSREDTQYDHDVDWNQQQVKNYYQQRIADKHVGPKEYGNKGGYGIMKYGNTFLIIAALGLGAFFVYRYMVKK